jgi:hypothetical protein
MVPVEPPVELCRRCGQRPGRERWYVPGEPGQVSFSLAGVTPKLSTRRTVGCDPCWQEFLELRGVPARPCCGLRHEGSECPDGLVMCQFCFERVPRDQLHGVNGDLEDVCVTCGASECKVVDAELVPGGLVPVTYLGSPPPGYRSYGDPWPPPNGHWSTVALAWLRHSRSWLPWVVVWLVGCALVVVGGGLDGVVAGVGLVAVGVGGSLFIRWLWEVLS